jgi:hypothetical protein
MRYLNLSKNQSTRTTSVFVLSVATAACFATVCYSQSAPEKAAPTIKADPESKTSTTDPDTKTTHTEADTKAPDTDPDIDKDGHDKQETPVSSDGKVQSALKWFKRSTSFWKLKYYFVGQNGEDCEFFYGLIQDNPMLGRASVDFESGKNCHCHGIAQVTKLPHGRSNIGQKGYIKVKCSDGRKMKGDFTTTSLTTGYATISDNLGHKYDCTFGHTASQAIEKINTTRRQLGCPEVTAEEVELKVQGRVLEK